MKVITIVMIFLSLFVGIPGFGKAVQIDDHWMTLYRFEFIDFPRYIGNIASWRQVGLWVCLLISHLAILLLLFLEGTWIYKRLLIWAPIVFIISFSLLSLLYMFLLIPFIVAWVIAVTIYEKSNIETKLNPI